MQAQRPNTHTSSGKQNSLQCLQTVALSEVYHVSPSSLLVISLVDLAINLKLKRCHKKL